MASLEGYVVRVKPALEAFLKEPKQQTLTKLQQECKAFDWMSMRIFNVQVLAPLVVKLEELKDENQDLRTGIINCLCLVLSKQYLTEEKATRSIFLALLTQICDYRTGLLRPNLSEEIKLATVECMAETLRRSTSDTLEEFYTKEKSVVLGQVLRILVEFLEHEKFKKLVLRSLECLMVIFYVHDEADPVDVVLRNQVANTVFLFLPKVLITLFKKTTADEHIGETIKSLSVKALGRIICIMFEETTDEFMSKRYDRKAFEKLFIAANADTEDCNNDDDIFFKRKSKLSAMEEQLKRLQLNLRCARWIEATSRKLRPILVQSCVLRAHSSPIIRMEYARMSCLLLENCAHNLEYNFIFILESVLAMSEDEDSNIAATCQSALVQLQQRSATSALFDENAEQLLDTHLSKLPRTLHRCEDAEQYAELLFIKAFLRNISNEKLHLLLLVRKNLEIFVACILAALDLNTSRDLLNEEHTLRQLSVANEDYAECAKLPWRKFKYLSTERSIGVLYEICCTLGNAPLLNRTIFDYCLELLEQQHAALNEIILFMTLMATAPRSRSNTGQMELVVLLVDQLLQDKHWHLALQADAQWRLKVEKPSSWFVDRTPGLYESAIEVRMQDCDSDDETEELDHAVRRMRVTLLDAQFNVLHTCIVLDALGNCAKYIGENFDRYVFRSLHRVLLKLANSNTRVYQASNFAFYCMQRALKFMEPAHFIEASTDYITYHLNSILKKTPESSSAVDILSVLLQFSTRSNIPHLDSIFQTIREECAKSNQSENIKSYLKVFNAFFQRTVKWQSRVDTELDAIPMQVDTATDEAELLNIWLNALNKSNIMDDFQTTNNDEINECAAESGNNKTEAEEEVEDDMPRTKPTLPKHIEMTKEILMQVIKFILNAKQTHQILSLECLISGIPLLRDYEDELLPLVHLIWQPLIEKFRQKDALVLNRCFSLLHILGLYAKDFILKRSLKDVVPYLKQFLTEAAAHSALENPKAQTQEFKLQLKLLQYFGSLIVNLKIEGKNLNEISETIALYLSQNQPKQLQNAAVQFYVSLRDYNGPFVYLILFKRAHLKDYKENVKYLLTLMNL